jgi:hypothetical protein
LRSSGSAQGNPLGPESQNAPEHILTLLGSGLLGLGSSLLGSRLLGGGLLGLGGSLLGGSADLEGGLHLDELAGLSTLLEGSTEEVLAEVDGGVLLEDVGLDGLLGGASAVLEGGDGLLGELKVRLLGSGHF